MECQPVVAHGVLYATSPTAARLRARRRDRRREVELRSPPGRDDAEPDTRIRGLMYWERGDQRRIYFAARNWLYALDATTGKPDRGFGRQGRIDLREGFEAATRARSASA